MAERLTPAELERVHSLEEFEPFARERMDPVAFEFVAGGSWDEISLAEAVQAWRRKRFIPRVLSGSGSASAAGSFLGRKAAIPVAMAPMAVQELAHPDGEVEVVRGAAAAGIPFTLSTASSRSIEDVAAAAPDAERWFQLYLVESMDYSRALVDRAAAAGYRAIMLTVDLPVVGHRLRDLRTGFKFPAQPHVDPASRRRSSQYGAIAEQQGVGLSWDRVREIQGWTSLPIVLKGIVSPLDADCAADLGVAGIIVSTHGARQLDRIIATADVLAPVVDAVAGRTEVWVDGGIRSALDVCLAAALGATGTLIGRPFYWALAAGGAAGIERAVAILHGELEIALALLGVERAAQLDRSFLA